MTLKMKRGYEKYIIEGNENKPHWKEEPMGL